MFVKVALHDDDDANKLFRLILVVARVDRPQAPEDAAADDDGDRYGRHAHDKANAHATDGTHQRALVSDIGTHKGKRGRANEAAQEGTLCVKEHGPDIDRAQLL